jgi:hypothetical protein
MGLDSSGPVSGSCEQGNDSINGGEFLDQMTDNQFLETDSDPWIL